MIIRHQGGFLEVTAKLETIITLSCDRCLQQYNQRLQVDQQEMIILDAAADQPIDYPLEQELAWEDLVETLSPQGHFQPEGWLYERLCLSLPSKQLCNQDCTGLIPANSTINSEPSTVIDHRWEALELLKKQLS